MNIILLGAPASGKGTMSNFLKQTYDIPAISTGDIIRENIKNKTSLGIKSQEYINAGVLVPDEIVIDLIRARLGQSDTANGYILDGFPRTLSQAVALDKISNITKVIYLNVGYNTLLERSLSRRICPKCNAIYNTKTHKSDFCDECDTKLVTRDDDNETVLKKRFDEFQSETKPLIAYYKKCNKLIEVDGSGDSFEVFKKISKEL